MGNLDDYLKSFNEDSEEKKKKQEEVLENAKREYIIYKNKFTNSVNNVIKPAMENFAEKFKNGGHKFTLSDENLIGPLEIKYSLTLNNDKWYLISIKAHKSIDGVKFEMSSPNYSIKNTVKKDYKFEEINSQNIEKDIIQCLKESNQNIE